MPVIVLGCFDREAPYLTQEGGQPKVTLGQAA